jgi:hypothetical protein
MAIIGFGSFKAVDEDGYFPALLKNGINALFHLFVKIFTAC